MPKPENAVPRHWYRRSAFLFLAAAVLAFFMVLVNHSWSKFYTGNWDGYSELLAVGRITQVQQGQSAPGDFLGIYTAEWGDGEGYTILKENPAQNPADYKSYAHQSGAQGTLEGALAKLLCRLPISGEMRLNVLYFANAWLFYTLGGFLCLRLAGHFGPGAGLGALAAVWFAPWLTMGAKNLYWVLWTWLLPCCAGLALAKCCRQKGKAGAGALLGVFAAVLVRCLCGFEYVTTVLILCEAPLAVCWLEETKRRKTWFWAMLQTGIAALAGALAALLVWLWQCSCYYGSWARAWQEVSGIALARAGAGTVEGDAASAATGQVPLGKALLAFVQDPGAQLKFGPIAVPVLPMLLLGALLALAVLLLALKHKDCPQLRGLCGLWVLGTVAPLSWMVLAKGHAYVHMHLTPMLWSFAALPCTLALLGWWVQFFLKNIFPHKEQYSQ